MERYIIELSIASPSRFNAEKWAEAILVPLNIHMQDSAQIISIIKVSNKEN